jgi:hypothetical protein
MLEPRLGHWLDLRSRWRVRSGYRSAISACTVRRVTIGCLVACILTACSMGSAQAVRVPTVRLPALPSSGPEFAPPSITSYMDRLVSLSQTSLGSYTMKSGPTDPRYWLDDSFLATDGDPCWYCYDSAAVLAAVISDERHGSAGWRRIAIDTFSTAVGRYQLPDGEFESNGLPDSVGTALFMAELGIVYLELREWLTPQKRSLWVNAVTRAANWLISAGQTTYYINGNVNLLQTEDLWLAHALTRDGRYLQAYNREWQFTLDPPRPRWAGYGLIYTKIPARSDPLSGAAYLTESVEGGKPGFDPSYTLAQLDDATSLYVLTRDPRYLELMSLLFNKDRPLVSPGYILDGYGGSRKDDLVPFTTAAPAVMVMSGARRDLLHFLLKQFVTIQQQYVEALSFSSVYFYKGLASDLSLPVLAVQWPNGLLGKPCNPAASTVCRALF